MDDLFLTNVKSKIYVCTWANIAMKLNIFKNGKCSSVLCMMWFWLRLLFCFIISHTAYFSLLPHAPHTKWSESHSIVSDSLRPHGLYSPWNSPGQNTGAGCLSLLQGIFPTQGLKPGLPHCGRIIYQLSHKGSLPLTPSHHTHKGRRQIYYKKRRKILSFKLKA